MGAVRVGVVGVGNCAASLVQGVHYYRDAAVDDRVPGLMHVKFGDYHVGDIEFVAAFDVDAKKVGLDLAEAIGASENNTIKFADVPPLGVPVLRGPTLDGVGEYYSEAIAEADEDPVDVVAALRENRVDVLVSYLPVGSEQADKFYAQCAIDAGVGFVNALPVFIASDPMWARKFAEAGVPIVGDDIKSQVGATITHRVMAKLFEDRGVKLERTYQLNFGGNMDFKNMLERSRLKSKKVSKTQAVTSQIPHEMRDADVHIGPSDFVPLPRRQEACVGPSRGTRLRGYADPLEYKLEVWDSRTRPALSLTRSARARSPGSWHRWPGPQRKLILHEKPTGPVRRLNRSRGGRAVSSKLILARHHQGNYMTFAPLLSLPATSIDRWHRGVPDRGRLSRRDLRPSRDRVRQRRPAIPPCGIEPSAAAPSCIKNGAESMNFIRLTRSAGRIWGGSMNRALVTGAAGFIGSHLCEALPRGAGRFAASIVSMISTTPGTSAATLSLRLEHPGFELIRGDLSGSGFGRYSRRRRRGRPSRG